jgi:hypothetical protein
MRPGETFAAHAEAMAAEHPRDNLAPDATPEERGEALVRVLRLAEALRQPGPPGRSRAMSIHEVVRGHSGEVPCEHLACRLRHRCWRIRRKISGRWPGGS